MKTHSTKYLSSTHYEVITKVYLEKKKKERKKEIKKENGKEKENKTVKSLPVFAAGLRFPRKPFIGHIGRFYTRDVKTSSETA